MGYQDIISCSFSKKQTAEENFHTEYELLFVLKGSILLSTNNREFPLKENDFFMINTGWQHSWSADGEILAGSLMIDFDQISAFFGTTPILFDCYSGDISRENAEQIRRLVYQLFTYSLSKKGLGRILYNSLCYRFIYLMVSDHLAKPNDPVWNFPRQGSQKRTYEILRFINENYAHPISLGSIAEQFGLTPPYLSKLFKDEFGTTFLSYLQTLRLNHATDDILYSEKSLTRIALDNGFPNPASFIRSFKQVYHMTPSEYRKAMKEPETVQLPSEEHDNPQNLDHEISDIVKSYLDSHGIREDFLPVSGQEAVRISAKHLSPEQTRKIRMPWKKLLHVGNASNLLRYDIREHVRMLRDELKFEYLYICNLLNLDMNFFSENPEGKPDYNAILQVLDYTVSLGMHPYIELESQEPYVPRSIDSDVVKAKIQSRLEYLCSHNDLLENLISLLLRRYGREEVSKWKISLERSTAENNTVSEKQYFKCFTTVSKILKDKVPGISVGGPGFTIDFSEKRLEKFLQNWMDSGTMPDFINLYAFPYNMNMDFLREKKNVSSTDRNYLETVLISLGHVMHRLGISDTDIHVTLWNSTLSNRNILNDSCFKAAYICNSMLGSWDKCSFLGYWNASDIPSSDSGSLLPFFGGSGLLTQNGLKKPAFFSYRFLNRLYPYVVTRTEHALITTDGRWNFTICCHNYKHYNYLYYQRPENRLKAEERNLYYEDFENLILRLSLSDLPDGTFLIRKWQVSEQEGNILEAWLKLGSPEEIEKSEWNYLNSRSEPGLSSSRVTSENGTIFIEETLRPQEICIITIELLSNT